MAHMSTTPATTATHKRLDTSHSFSHGGVYV